MVMVKTLQDKQIIDGGHSDYVYFDKMIHKDVFKTACERNVTISKGKDGSVIVSCVINLK